MSYIVVILGISDSGKDSLTKCLEGINIKFSRPQKKVLEEWGGLPDGALELDEYRNMELPLTPGITYLDALIATYHFWQEFAPLANKAGVIRKAKDSLDNGIPVIFTDIRMLEELTLVTKLGYEIFTIKITREGTVAKTSDLILGDIYLELVKYSSILITCDNNSTKEDLQKFAYKFQKEIDLYMENHNE